MTSQLESQGRELAPVSITARGHKIAETFWGTSWCQNLERHSDYASRLPRGRTYARNGSVIDLQIKPGRVQALVSGSEVYEVEIAVTPLPKKRWQKLCADCAGDIDSLIELLQGQFSDGVMDILCRPDTGIFPEPKQIQMSCSCLDWATMCKHVAAALYGIGARLDTEPELLFTLRQVDQTQLVSAKQGGIATATAGTAAEELAGEDLGAIFGIELAEPASSAPKQPQAKKAPAAKTAKKKGTAKKVAAKKTVKKAPAKRPAPNPPRKAAKRDPRITAAELRERGVPSHIAQAWLRKGLLTHSGIRGVYVRTDDVEALIKDCLARVRRREG